MVNFSHGAANIKQLASPNFSRLMSSLFNPIFTEFLNFLVRFFKPFEGDNASFLDISNKIVGMDGCCPLPLSASMSVASDNIFRVNFQTENRETGNGWYTLTLDRNEVFKAIVQCPQAIARGAKEELLGSALCQGMASQE